MMSIFVFDLETSGIPDFRKPADDPAQPRAAQIAGLLIEERDAEPAPPLNLPGVAVIGSMDMAVRPDGWTMDDALAEKMGHGFTHERLLEIGRPIGDALAQWGGLHDQASLLITWGGAFDLKMMRGELRRAGMNDRYAALPRIDLMRAASPICALPFANGRGGIKLPKLEEAANILLGEIPEGLHNARIDAVTTARIYFALKARGVVFEPKQDVSTKAAE